MGTCLYLCGLTQINNIMATAIIVLAVILFIIISIIVTVSNEKEKELQEQERAKQRRKEEENRRKEVEENRRMIEEEVSGTLDRDLDNKILYENSTLGRYKFKVKGLTHRSENSQAGAWMLRMWSPLYLEHEEGNEYDTFAMRVYSVTGNFWLGYVEREKSLALYSVRDNIKACMITDYSYGVQAPYITATAYFQKVIDGVPQPYTLGTKKVDMPSEINTDNTISTFRSYISKALKKEDWNEKTFNEVQARADFLLSNGIKMSERVKEELRARGVKLKETGEF